MVSIKYMKALGTIFFLSSASFFLKNNRELQLQFQIQIEFYFLANYFEKGKKNMDEHQLILRLHSIRTCSMVVDLQFNYNIL
jgi:hypothetical protein